VIPRTLDKQGLGQKGRYKEGEMRMAVASCLSAGGGDAELDAPAN